MQELTVAWEHARAQFPDVEVSEVELRAYLAGHSTQPGPVHPTGQGSETGNPLTIITDMYLACACARGDDRAIAAFRRRYAQAVETVRARFRSRAPSTDELWSEIEQRLFVRQGDKPARIEEYAGRSELAAWLKVVASRIVLNRMDAEKPESPTDDRLFDGMLVTTASPELAVAAAENRALLKSVFERATGELTPRERRLLRLAFTEGFTIDDIGALYGIHRSSAARWVKDASAALSKHVARIARGELRLSPEQLESLARGFSGSIDLSLARYLATVSPET